MAYIQTSPAKHPVTDAISSIATAIASFFADVIKAQSRANEFEAMNALTDTELATRYGIERRDIVEYIFRDKWV